MRTKLATTTVANQSTSTSTSTSAKNQIDLIKGWPNPSLHPPEHLGTSAHSVFSDPDISVPSLKYGDDAGYRPLRDGIAEWLNDFYQPQDGVTYDRICITGGASQNLACALQAFTDPIYTRNVWMIAPTYFLACRIFDDSGFAGRMKAVPEDEEGIDTEILENLIHESERRAVAKGNTKPKLKTAYPWRRVYKHIIYGVPTFANPSGRLMTLQRREQLVRIARKYDALIITDDVYDMLLWSKSPGIHNHQHSHNHDNNVSDIPFRQSGPITKAHLPRIVDIDRSLDGGPLSEFGNALSNGTFSKIVAPGVRTGWAEATPKLVWALSQCGSSRSGGAPSQVTASIIHQFLASGDLPRHVYYKLQPAYATRYHTMMRAVKAHLLPLGLTMLDQRQTQARERGQGQVQVQAPERDQNTTIAGGYFVWLTIPPKLMSLDADGLALKAKEEENVLIIPGPRFQVEGDVSEANRSFENSFRLCFAWEEVEALDEGVVRLARVVRKYLL